MKTFITLLFIISVQAFAGDQELKVKALELVNETPGLLTSASVPLNKHISILNTGEGKHKTIYVGRRQTNIPRAEFVREMNKHISMVRDIFKSKGLLHYSVYLTEEYELAVQEWVSEAHAQKVFSSPEMKQIGEHAGRLLLMVTFEKVDEINCSSSKRKDLNVRFIRIDDEYYKHLVTTKNRREVVYRDMLQWFDYQGSLVLESKKTSVVMEDMSAVLYTYTSVVNGTFKELTETLNCGEL